MAKAKTPFDPGKFENIFQVGGITTGTIDWPQPNGGGSCRVAMVDTGSGLRFTIALDRGGDILDASYKGCALAYLTPNGATPPNHAHHADLEWLSSWPGGLVTTCGPLNIGLPTPEDRHSSLHGHFSNTPAAVNAVTNPNPWQRKPEMSIDLTIRDTRFFGPNIEVQRRIACRLGESVIEIHDRVSNIGDRVIPHQYLYHVNLGHPLLDHGARLIYGGHFDASWDLPTPPHKPSPIRFPSYKRVPDALASHAGAGERGLIIRPAATRNGKVRVGLINSKRGIGFELSFLRSQLPRLANWQHFGPRGSYVCGLEPFNGALRDDDKSPLAKRTLRPGQTVNYDLTLSALEGRAALADLARCDATLTK